MSIEADGTCFAGVGRQKETRVVLFGVPSAPQSLAEEGEQQGVAVGDHAQGQQGPKQLPGTLTGRGLRLGLCARRLLCLCTCNGFG